MARKRSGLLGSGVRLLALVFIAVLAPASVHTGTPIEAASSMPPDSGGSAGGSEFVPGVEVPPGAIAEPAPPSSEPVRTVPRLLTWKGAVGKARANRGESQPTSKSAVSPRTAAQWPSGGSAVEAGSEAPLGGPETDTTASGPQANTPILGGSFVGATFSSIPPDPALAVGPSTLVALVNFTVNKFRKNGAFLSSQSLQSFFGTSLFTFDPKARYDPNLGRFWAIAVSRDDATLTSIVHIALSDTSDASAGWGKFHVNARLNGSSDSGFWCDYPQLGIDAQAIYLTCNMFSFPKPHTFQYAKIRVMSKDQFVNKSCCRWWDFVDLREGSFGSERSFTIQPAQMFTSSASVGEFLVDARGQGGSGNALQVRRITNAQNCCNGSTTGPTLQSVQTSIGSYSTPPDARQAGTSTRIETGDSRLLYAFWKDGRLSAGQNLACGTDACVGFTELNVSSYPSVSVVNDWVYSTAGVDYYYPAVDVNVAGNKTMVFTRSGLGTFAGARYIGIPSSSTCTFCLDGPEAILRNGQNRYVRFDAPVSEGGKNRWGDYLGAARDPDGTGIWIHGEFAAATADTWGTQIGLTYENIVGTFELTPSHTTIALGDEVTYVLKWTVPEFENWHDLRTVEVRFRDPARTVLWVRFDEDSNTFSVVNPASGHIGPGGTPGSPSTLGNAAGTLHLAQSSVQGSGPEGPSVVLTLPFDFKPPAGGRTYDVQVKASDDAGNDPGFERAGTLTVTR